MSDFEIMTDGARRRRWSSEKLRIVEETLDETAGISIVGRRNGIAPNLLYRWRLRMLGGGPVAVSGDDDDEQPGFATDGRSHPRTGATSGTQVPRG